MSIELKKDLREVEVEGLKFWIRPETFLDLSNILKWAKENGVDNDKDAVQTYALNAYAFMMRIEKWEGVVHNGKKAPCTMDNKMLLFGQNPRLIPEILNEYGKLLEADSKN